MKKIIIWLCLCSQIAEAAPTLSFNAKIKNEALSEEAILLLHCLADESDSNWELSPVVGVHTLTMREESPQEARGSYKINDETHEVLLAVGQAEKVCREIYPEQKEYAEPASTEAPSSVAPKSSSKALWISLGVAALAGFFVWKSRQPEHQGIVMR